MSIVESSFWHSDIDSFAPHVTDVDDLFSVDWSLYQQQEYEFTPQGEDMNIVEEYLIQDSETQSSFTTSIQPDQTSSDRIQTPPSKIPDIPQTPPKERDKHIPPPNPTGHHSIIPISLDNLKKFVTQLNTTIEDSDTSRNIYFRCHFPNCSQISQSRSFEAIIHHIHSVHLGGKKFFCRECSKIYSRKDYRDLHMAKCFINVSTGGV
ncbi:hypothetical protein Clacol_005921 [Clathrus columnatus]|uniref:C2H2-type domain-containing protein n=1 Tax=Clathrus columnatus TaxID=1419009 RepID=A0AAV5ABG5_9AGAM|nr:hypothetical protein Clacol_005921 [Clathrus columnatus]